MKFLPRTLTLALSAALTLPNATAAPENPPMPSGAMASGAMSGMNHGAIHGAAPAPKLAPNAAQDAMGTRNLPPLPLRLPSWLDSKKNNEIFYQRGAYNFAIYDIPALARDMNGVAVGHSLAYEALVTGRADALETSVWEQIHRVLKNPPKLMPAERVLSPSFARRFGTLELMFDWTHVSHAQTIDNLVSTKADNAEKDRETTRLWNFYARKGAPFTLTGLPMNMAWLDSQPYSQAFRRKYPRVNALFWGYHWLQTAVYDGLRAKTLAEQKRVYEILGERYHTIELFDTARPFMPMMGETSPLFAAQYPEIANAFDNLHMLHDMVNDILASDWISEPQKQEQIKRAIFMLSSQAHRECKAGENRGLIDGISHDHRFMQGMPGMGMMKNGSPAQLMGSFAAAPHSAATTSGNGLNHSGHGSVSAPNGALAGHFDPTELMWMPQMGWMSMSECHHCSMPLPGAIKDRGEEWQASTLSAQGWTMRVRCALCARDMSAEVKGRAILSLATEDPQKRVVVFSDAQGQLSTLFEGATFLEEKAGHPRCNAWSQAFSSRAAFDAYIKKNPRYAGAKPLSFEKWASVEPDKTPETYAKETGPVENPYAADLRARGIAQDGIAEGGT